MCNLYNTLSQLCEERRITGYRMCKDCGISPGAMTDLKAGRKKILSAVNMQKLADYFGVSVDYLLGHNETKKQPAVSSELHLPENLSDDKLRAIQFILSHNDDEIKRFMAVGDVMFDKG